MTRREVEIAERERAHRRVLAKALGLKVRELIALGERDERHRTVMAVVKTITREEAA